MTVDIWIIDDKQVPGWVIDEFPFGLKRLQVRNPAHGDERMHYPFIKSFWGFNQEKLEDRFFEWWAKR